MTTNEWLTVDEIAQELKLHPDTIREYIRKKELPAYRFGRDYRVRKEDYEEWLKKRRTTDDKDTR